MRNITKTMPYVLHIKLRRTPLCIQQDIKFNLPALLFLVCRKNLRNLRQHHRDPSRNEIMNHTFQTRHTIPSFIGVAGIAGLALLFSNYPSQGASQDETPTTRPQGKGQLSSPAKWFTSGKDELGHDIEYHGQASQHGKIILTASNGFFDSGIVAKGKSNLKDVANGAKTGKGHALLIAHDYAYLDNWGKPGQSMRWHLYLPKKGEVKCAIHLKPNPENPDGVIIVSLDGQEKRIKTSDTKALKDGLVFKVTKQGKQMLQLTAKTTNGKPLGQLSTIDLYGPAIENAKLLRARWRPAAVHGSYRSSKMEDTTMWVMVSKSLSPTRSYSPITTPFGYYGGSFDAQQRFAGGFNFSMWSNQNAPIEQQAHLLALGSPQLHFSGFGHEGTGVKPRGWSPLEKTKPKEVVQCLRVERGEKYNTYYGYYIDPETDSWKLFCVGRKWVGGVKGKSRRGKKSLWPGSFVEVPGPPQVQRSGDIIRRVVRKGWCVDAQGEWHRLDILPAGKTNHNNKSWGATKDGWFLFKMGGMAHFSGPAENIQLPEKFLNERLPDFLSPEKVKQLYQLPVMFGKQTATPGSKSATLDINLTDAGTNARAVVYYGEKDCGTFAPRKKSGTERKNSTLKEEHLWKKFQKITSVKAGENTINLEGLKPNTKYYYRTIIHNDQGTMWDFESHSFTTQPKS